MSNKLIEISNIMQQEVENGTASDPFIWLSENNIKPNEFLDWIDYSFKNAEQIHLELIGASFEVGYRFAKLQEEEQYKEV